MTQSAHERSPTAIQGENLDLFGLFLPFCRFTSSQFSFINISSFPFFHIAPFLSNSLFTPLFQSPFPLFARSALNFILYPWHCETVLCIVALRVGVYRGLKVVPSCSYSRHLLIHFVRQFSCRMYRLAKTHSEKPTAEICASDSHGQYDRLSQQQQSFLFISSLGMCLGFEPAVK